MKTLVAKQIPGNERKWYVVDAQDKNLGRLSTSIARLLSGRDAVDFTPHIDNGAYVVVINVAGIAVTGKKESDKMYYSHSQYLGGLKERNLSDMRKKKPSHILKHAIEGMLPKNKLQASMIDRLKLVDGATHIYEAQKPQTITL
jgi:large subunit ribosomal protein L13